MWIGTRVVGPLSRCLCTVVVRAAGLVPRRVGSLIRTGGVLPTHHRRLGAALLTRHAGVDGNSAVIDGGNGGVAARSYTSGVARDQTKSHTTTNSPRHHEKTPRGTFVTRAPTPVDAWGRW